MKQCQLLLLLILGWLAGKAQKNDYIWLQGYDAVDGSNPNFNIVFGNPIMDFTYNPVKITRDSLSMNFAWTNTSYSDSNGNLLFYTNGIWVANSINDTIENSDSLNWGLWLQYADNQHGNEGYLVKQGIYALQSLTDSNQYYLIYTQIDTNGWSADALLCALIDMSLNQGRGKVIYKNRVLINDNIDECFTLVRHGNGRFWWIITQKVSTNCYYRVLLDESGPHLVADSVCAGSVHSLYDYGPMNFSENGNKLFHLGYLTGLDILDFDRCTGQIIGDAVNIPYPFLSDSNWLGGGLATSPDSRYLYVNLVEYIFQYDLLAMDIAGSIDTVGIWDGTVAPFPTDFFTAQNGPDGKIYISCGNADTLYSVINNPDAEGASCDLVQHGVHLPSPSWGIPNYPNYRLGALNQSQCDSLSGLNEVQRAAKEQIIKVYPNPATDYTIVDYGFTDWSKAQPTLQVCSPLGQSVYQQTLPMYSGLQKIEVSTWAAGMYTVFIKRSGAVIATSKFVKQ